MGEKVFNAGQYMLQEIEKSVEEAISHLNRDEDTDVLEKLSRVDNVETLQDINNIVQDLYSKVKEQSKARYRGKKVDFENNIDKIIDIASGFIKSIN